MLKSIAYSIEGFTPKTVIKLMPYKVLITLPYDISKFSHSGYVGEFLQARQWRRQHRYHHCLNNSTNTQSVDMYDFIVQIRNELLHFIFERIENPRLEHSTKRTFQEMTLASEFIEACDNFLYQHSNTTADSKEALERLHLLMSATEDLPLKRHCVLRNIIKYAKTLIDIQMH